MLLNKKIPFAYLAKKVYKDLTGVLIYSILVVLIKIEYLDYLPEIHIALPSILGTSISLLLAFKLNQSYDRWWEGRKIWGSIVNDSRTLPIQLMSFIPDEELAKPEIMNRVKKIAYRQIAWCYCLGNSLRSQPLEEIMRDYMSEQEIEELRYYQNRPAGMLALHGRDFKNLRKDNLITELQHVQLDNTLVRLVDSQGRAERIKGTVFPRTYKLFIHLFIYLFLGVLSLALVETIGYYEIPFLLLIAATFFLVEKTATKLQDPFENRETDVPITNIASKIEINIKHLIGEKKAVTRTDAEPETFYVL